MFVLNKNISSEALATFYRENQFVFPADESLSSLRVLQRLSPVSRQHIRFIGFDLRYPDLQGMLSEEDARRDWRRLIYFIDNHLNLPQLFLCIVSNWRNWWYEHDDDDFFSRDPKAVEHEILAPVRHMRGLRRVFLSTVWHDWEEQLLELEMTGEGISHLTAEEALQKLCAYPHDIWNLLRPRDYDWIEA
ncbi:hypothetical protein MMC14_000626 [Varicellaria rhodocarpa]|nr:hypothetical protein [Varicellaria rhodocarpa]